MAQGPKRNYVFTLFESELTEHSAREHIDSLGRCASVRYVVGQLERCPTSSRLHVQGYLELNNPMRMSAVKKLFTGDVCPHLETRRGTREQARAYSRKEDSRLHGPWEVGDWGSGGAGKRTDIAALKETIDGGADDAAVWDGHFGSMLKYHRSVAAYRLCKSTSTATTRCNIRVVVYYGPTGTGKSHAAFSAEPDGTVFNVPRSQGESLWFDGYDPTRHRTLIIDEFYGWIKWDLLLRLLDKYPLSLPVKGGMTYANWTKVIITSNKPPDAWYSLEKIHDQAPLMRRIDEIVHMDKAYVPPVTSDDLDFLEMNIS